MDRGGNSFKRSRYCGPISDGEPDDPSHIVTLVHGTFARGAAWTKEGSTLAQALRTGLGGVRIERCEWSGWNGIGARRKGADRLARHLGELLKAFPTARHFVIAHSHGGNISLYAMRNPELGVRIAGIVCIATPFLVARRRDLGREGVATLLAAPLILSAAAWGFLNDELRAAAPWLPEIVGLALWTFVAMVVVAWLFARWDRGAKRILETLRLPEATPPLLIMRAPGDEASALLIFFQFLSLLAVRLFHLLSRLHARSEDRFRHWARRKGRLAVLLLSGLVLAPLIGAALLTIGASTTAVVMVLLVVVLPLLVVPVFLLLGLTGPAAIGIRFLASMVLVPAALILAVCMIPVDWRVGLANLLVDVTVEPAPPGKWQIHELVPGPSSETPDLAHSVLYRDPDALQDIVRWIAGAPATTATENA